jgi:uncharacterized protein (DUF1330 family)
VLIVLTGRSAWRRAVSLARTDRPVPHNHPASAFGLQAKTRKTIAASPPASRLAQPSPYPKEGIMKKGYWVVTYRSISDTSAVKAYGALAVPAVQAFNGRFLTMSASQVQVHEAGLQQPTVLVEFDSYDIARSAHKSEAYQKALQALGSGALRDVRIVEGV